MRVYQCDSCKKKTITNPYKVKMKEFALGVDFCCGILLPTKSKLKIKIHLCEDCYEGLQLLANKRRGEQ